METGKMLIEAGLCLRDNNNQLTGGFWPPGGGLGEDLMNRLMKVGIHFETKGIPAE